MLCPDCNEDNVIKLNNDDYFCENCDEIFDEDDIIIDVVDYINNGFNNKDCFNYE